MKYCKNCGANIEGLVAWCDCCGESILPPNFFILYAHSYMEAGDIWGYSKSVVNKLNSSSLSDFFASLSGIDFELYCYPADLIRNMRIKNSIRLNRKRNTATVRFIIDYDMFLHASEEMKPEIVYCAVRDNLLLLAKKINDINVENYTTLIEEIDKQLEL